MIYAEVDENNQFLSRKAFTKVPTDLLSNGALKYRLLEDIQPIIDLSKDRISGISYTIMPDKVIAVQHVSSIDAPPSIDDEYKKKFILIFQTLSEILEQLAMMADPKDIRTFVLVSKENLTKIMNGVVNVSLYILIFLN